MESNIKNELLMNLGIFIFLIIPISGFYSASKYNKYKILEVIKLKKLQLINKNHEIVKQKEDLEELNIVLEKKNKQLFLSSTRDSLTEIYNRMYLSELFSKEMTKSKRHFTALSCIMVDIDCFKGINDKYGHLAGDYILKSVASLIKNCIRNGDIFGRYGGDEFLLVFPHTSLKNAEIVAEKIKKKVQDENFVFHGDTIKVTLSIGVSEIDDLINREDEMIKNADTALYKSKETGRNRVEVYKNVEKEHA